ncbi:hypothetical protein D6C91_00203 [Aureobasidium pullulans]|uniref:Uncharacterized protein n=1 Tax=Aureobasidium pullulans TaxID=5580 RepID=A0A4S9U4Q1_AURPU|nr:hypothetical protein D6C91_00203 [Aureobasidium pullulans]
MTTSRNWPLLVILVFQLFCTNMLSCALLATTTTDIVAVDPEVHEYKFPYAGWTLAPHKFDVYLGDNHTLEKHWECIGQELPVTVHFKAINQYRIEFITTGAVNSIEREGEILALIRSDPNVELVSQVFWTRLSLGPHFHDHLLDDNVDLPRAPIYDCSRHGSLETTRSSNVFPCRERTGKVH